MEIELVDEFDKNHEAGCSLMIDLDGGKPFRNLGCLECTSHGHSHEIDLIEYFPTEEVREEYELHDFQHIDDETFEEDQILRHLEELIVEVIIGETHCEMMVMSSHQYIISHHEPICFKRKIHFLNTFNMVQVCMILIEVWSIPMSFSLDILFLV